MMFWIGKMLHRNPTSYVECNMDNYSILFFSIKAFEGFLVKGPNAKRDFTMTYAGKKWYNLSSLLFSGSLGVLPQKSYTFDLLRLVS